MRPARSGGGWHSLLYSLRMAARAGGLLRFYRALRSRNACKTCALGMGGQRGGMVNEAGRFPEVCKKSMQAMAADMQGAIRPQFFERYGFAELQRLSPRELEHLGRIGNPLLAEAGDAVYRVIGWDEALQRCITRLRAAPPDDTFFYFSGRASNEAAFLWQLFARLYGTNNVNNCSYYCHQASGVGLKAALGTGTATVALEDVERCDLLFLIGANPASNHPRMMSMLADLRRRGGHVIVVNPLKEPGLVKFRIPSRPLSLLLGDDIASQYLQPNIGGDIAVLLGIAKALRERHPASIDTVFIANHTTDFEAFGALVEASGWEQIVEASGVPRAQLERVAELYANSKATIFAWTMGITHHVHGVENVRAIVNLALLRGMAGRPGAGLLPIRGHSNVQGVGSVGVSPQLAPAVLERLERRLGVKLPTSPGMDTLACMHAMEQGRVRHAICLGGNLFGNNPDATRTAAAFGRLEFVAYVSTTLNTGHAWGRAKETLILPAAARDEESQSTTQESMFNFVRLSEGGPPRVPEARSEVSIVADLAAALLPGGPIDWSAMRDHRRIRETLAAVVPGFEELATIDQTRREFHIAGRVLHQPAFPTADGRARFCATAIPATAPLAAHEVRLATIRSEGQFNTVVYEDEDVYRGQERRDVILLNEADMARWKVRADQPVTVRSACGEMRGVWARPYDLPPGNAAMYCPECNVLVPRDADPQSRTPAFKNVRVTIMPESGLPVVGQ